MVRFWRASLGRLVWLRPGKGTGASASATFPHPSLLKISLKLHTISTITSLCHFLLSHHVPLTLNDVCQHAVKKIVRRMQYLICKYYGLCLRGDSSVSPSWNPYLVKMDSRKRDIQLNKSLGRWLFWNIYKKYFPMVSFSHWIFCLWAGFIKMSSHINKLHFTNVKALSKNNVPVIHKLLVLALPIETFFYFTFETQNVWTDFHKSLKLHWFNILVFQLIVVFL